LVTGEDKFDIIINATNLITSLTNLTPSLLKYSASTTISLFQLCLVADSSKTCYSFFSKDDQGHIDGPENMAWSLGLTLIGVLCSFIATFFYSASFHRGFVGLLHLGAAVSGFAAMANFLGDKCDSKDSCQQSSKDFAVGMYALIGTSVTSLLLGIYVILTASRGSSSNSRYFTMGK
jgi:hypothetical protein